MRMVVQRVREASVAVGDECVGRIGPGLLIFLGVGKGDGEEDIEWLIERVAKLRVFEDAEGRMNLSLREVDGEALVVSQFTLFGSLKKGNRPSFNRAAPPELARTLYEDFAGRLAEVLNKQVPTGRFAADMRIMAENDGPVTLFVDSKQRDF